ncbi:NEAT domain-containing protein [Marinisporobacter balticus]|uniref:Iron transport-associated protein n=1 Tax=Marinisporobacter balticus TaxID=2018667 RepID=A0A4R2KF31_9FIRM|nr:NEAT domain-containing protein [Marinisporobacter balticus]TCO68919.1 iron transport-associated protein [Marinisporobacter balticus]
MFSNKKIKKYTKNIMIAMMAVLMMVGGIAPIVADAATETVNVKAYKVDGSGDLSMADGYLNDQADIVTKNGISTMTLTFSSFASKMEDIKVSIAGMGDQIPTTPKKNGTDGFSFEVPDTQTDIEVSMKLNLGFFHPAVEFIVHPY